MEYRLETPLVAEDVKKLEIGDIVYLSGLIYTFRDRAHQRAMEYKAQGKPLPLDLEGAVIYHCGPIVKEEEGEWRLVVAGPTTSARLNRIEPEFIRSFGIRGIIGKGGMDKMVLEAMMENSCVYLAFPGGCAVLAASAVEKVEGVEWYDLGMAEAVWKLRVRNFGPLIVAMDTHGDSIYDNVAELTPPLDEIL
ncbi:MAG: fumarate hydratase C-terminal domain-containing protein [Synergistetes bacterium]|nr:fumarate hydratase C-terminal domain-containing protein [Synergistota bacterium]